MLVEMAVLIIAEALELTTYLDSDCSLGPGGSVGVKQLSKSKYILGGVRN